MNQTQSFVTESLSFTLRPQNIDYFKIPVDMFKSDGFEVSYHELTPNPGAPFTKEDLDSLDTNTRETVILNMQTGKGKTTVCYDLIQQYAQAGYIVFVLSPFKKLIEKDYEALIDISGVKVFNYNSVDNLDWEALTMEEAESYIEPALNCNVQIMTINCLLQNPGEGTPRQSKIKRAYLDELFDAYRNKGCRIVIFIDEIHESIFNFHFDYIPNLIRWEPMVHKCFVSSATFVPASYAAIKFIAMLTEAKINVYEMPRHKLLDIDGQLSSAKLHLHFIDQEYSSGNLAPLEHLVEVIDEYASSHKINILTAYKSFTDSLMRGDRNNPVISKIRILKPRVLTSDTNNLFDPSGNNIGTNFKTGINMVGDDSVLIIILPYYKNRETVLGVFSDGIPSIIQSLARIRGNGNVHIFLSKPSYILDKDTLGLAVPDAIGRNTPAARYRTQNWSLGTLRQTYAEIRSQREDTITWINTKQTPSKHNSNPTYALNYTYPSYEQYLVADSQTHLVKNHPAFGSDLSSYILWGGLTDQFCNGRLVEITYTSAMENKVEITDDNIQSVLTRYISEDIFEACKSHPFGMAYGMLTDRMANTFTTKNDDDGNKSTLRMRNTFVKGKREYNLSELKRQATFVKVGLDMLVNAWSGGAILTIDPKDYIAVCRLNAVNTQSGTIQPTLIHCYKQLDTLCLTFLKFVSDNYTPNRDGLPTVHRDLYMSMPDQLTEQMVMLSIALQKEDFFIGSGAIPFLRASMTKTGIDQKKSIYNEFKRYFTNISSDMVKVTGKEEYYMVEGTLDRTITPPLTELVILR